MTSNHNLKRWATLMVGVIFIPVMFIACSSDNSESPEIQWQKGDYVAVGAQYFVYASDIQTILNSNSAFTQVNAIYNVAFFKITYKTTDTNGNLTTASGIVAVPQKSNHAASPLLSLQHGTIFLDSDAPSNENLISAIANPGQALNTTTAQAVIAASAGFLVVAADYLGYGDSTVTVHPYMHSHSLATAVIDLILASKQYFAQNSIIFNGQTFLAGYSEGGYATLAAQKLLQEAYGGVISVTASAPGAGAYDVTQTAAKFASSTPVNNPPIVAFTLKAYDVVYALNRLSEFFPAPYADFIDTAFDGDKTYSDIDSVLPSNPTELFNPVFLQNFNGNGESTLKVLFAENDIFAWSPDTPTYFFHGADDAVVPYYNMISAMNAMQTDAQVQFTDCTAVPADHNNCFMPYLQFVFAKFSSFALDL